MLSIPIPSNSHAAVILKTVLEPYGRSMRYWRHTKSLSCLLDSWLLKISSLWEGIRLHYCDVIMGAMASQITSLTTVYSTIHSGADQRKHQSSASLAFGWGIHRWPVNSSHKGPVLRKMFPFDDVIMDVLSLVRLLTNSWTYFVPVFGMVRNTTYTHVIPQTI